VTTDFRANVARFCANPVEYVPLARSLLISQFAWAKNLLLSNLAARND
jgi:hypothetical protein